MAVAGDIDDENTHNTTTYFRNMDIDVKNIDKKDNNAWRTIYEVID